MTALQDKSQALHDKQEVPQARHLPFDTQMSQQINHNNEERDFSPWVRQKTIIHHQYSPQQLDYHRFLASIRLSPRHRGKFRKDQSNIQQMDNLQILKADLTSKIKAEKIANCQYTQQKINSRTTHSKNFFQRRANLTKLYRRPKSIDLSLEFDPINILKCSRFNNANHSVNPEQPIQNKKQLRSMHKLKKKKENTEEQKKLSATMKNFRVSIMSVQKKVYQTLEFNISQAYQKTKRPQTDHEIKALTYFSRPKFSKPKHQRQTIELSGTLACLGKNAIVSLGHKTCREKIKEQKFFSKAQQNQIFT